MLRMVCSPCPSHSPQAPNTERSHDYRACCAIFSSAELALVRVRKIRGFLVGGSQRSYGNRNAGRSFKPSQMVPTERI
jgi:hypothetical protein